MLLLHILSGSICSTTNGQTHRDIRYPPKEDICFVLYGYVRDLQVQDRDISPRPWVFKSNERRGEEQSSPIHLYYNTYVLSVQPLSRLPFRYMCPITTINESACSDLFDSLQILCTSLFSTHSETWDVTHFTFWNFYPKIPIWRKAWHLFLSTICAADVASKHSGGGDKEHPWCSSVSSAPKHTGSGLLQSSATWPFR